MDSRIGSSAWFMTRALVTSATPLLRGCRADETATHNVVDGNSHIEARKTPSLGVALIVTAWVVAAVLVNIKQFPGLQRKAAPEHKVFATWRGNLLESGTRLRTVVGRHRAPLELRKVAPGSTLIIPKEGHYPPAEFMGLLTQWGRVRSVRQLDYDPKRFASAIDIDKSVLGSTISPKDLRPGQRRFVVIGPSDNPARQKHAKKKHAKKKPQKRSQREFILLKRGANDVLLDTSMVKKEVGKLEP